MSQIDLSQVAAMDRHWNLVMHNRLVPLLMAGAAPELLQGRVNVLRLSLHPQGLASRIANLRQWREHLFEFHTPYGPLRLVCTTAVFGSPVDITLQELALETFFPADDSSAELLRTIAAQA